MNMHDDLNATTNTNACMCLCVCVGGFVCSQTDLAVRVPLHAKMRLFRAPPAEKEKRLTMLPAAGAKFGKLGA